jgi:predicted metal-dependent hydrolase
MADPIRLDTFEGASVHLRRTNRKKSISLSIREGGIVILAPRRVPDREIFDLIVKKAPWIRSKLAKQATLPQIGERKFVDGDIFLFLGEEYPLRVMDGPKATAELEEGIFVVQARRTHIQERRARSVRAAFLRWYKEEAETLFTDRTGYYADQMGAAPGRILFRDYKSMWGKCTGQGEITYNWKLVMAPPLIVDYVIVHELAHLHHLNHSREFWNCVEKMIPDHKARRNWLKDHGQTLTV